MAPEAIQLTTTLNRLRDAGACAGRYAHLVKALGGTTFDHDLPINLLTILDLNGADDCLWALCATAENCDQVVRLMAADFAEAVLHIYERNRPNDNRPRAAIEAARAFARGEIGTAAMKAAGNAALSAVVDAAMDSVSSEAVDASLAAFWAASWAPRNAVNGNAVNDAIVWRYLLPWLMVQ